MVTRHFLNRHLRQINRNARSITLFERRLPTCGTAAQEQSEGHNEQDDEASTRRQEAQTRQFQPREEVQCTEDTLGIFPEQRTGQESTTGRAGAPSYPPRSAATRDYLVT